MIWLIGGTSESVDIARYLLKRDIPFLVSVASDTGKMLYDKIENIQCVCGKYTVDDFRELFILNGIDTVIDASHPFAENVKANVKTICAERNIKYIRHERLSVREGNIIHVANYEEAAKMLVQTTGNVLLTTGANHLHLFKKWINSERLYIRILPRKESLDIAYNLGFKMDNIIAIKGPFSVEFNEAMIINYDIHCLVTKDSGLNGGVNEKIQACNNMNIPCILIDRPKIEYEYIVYNIEELDKYIV